MSAVARNSTRSANTTVTLTLIEPASIDIYIGRMGPHQIRKTDFATETMHYELFRKQRSEKLTVIMRSTFPTTYVVRLLPTYNDFKLGVGVAGEVMSLDNHAEVKVEKTPYRTDSDENSIIRKQR